MPCVVIPFSKYQIVLQGLTLVLLWPRPRVPSYLQTLFRLFCMTTAYILYRVLSSTSINHASVRDSDLFPPYECAHQFKLPAEGALFRSKHHRNSCCRTLSTISAGDSQCLQWQLTASIPLGKSIVHPLSIIQSWTFTSQFSDSSLMLGVLFFFIFVSRILIEQMYELYSFSWIVYLFFFVWFFLFCFVFCFVLFAFWILKLWLGWRWSHHLYYVPTVTAGAGGCTDNLFSTLLSPSSWFIFVWPAPLHLLNCQLFWRGLPNPLYTNTSGTRGQPKTKQSKKKTTFYFYF